MVQEVGFPRKWMNTSLSPAVNPTNLMPQRGQFQGEVGIAKGSGCLGLRGSGIVRLDSGSGCEQCKAASRAGGHVFGAS